MRLSPHQDRARLALACLLAWATNTHAEFVDVTQEAGIHHLQWQPTPGRSYTEPYYMSGGAAAGDYDGDGWVDLFVTRMDDTDILYRNNRDGTFSDVSLQAGFTVAAATNGATWGDIDHDGDSDLYVSAFDSNQFYLYVNDGAGHFQEQAVRRGADIPASHNRYGYSVTMGDYDLDGYLDIHTTEWGASPQGNPSGPISTVARLLRNQGADNPGHFVDVTETAQVGLDGVVGSIRGQAVRGVYSFASRFTDMDRDGLPDLVIAGDFQTSRLFWNNGDGTFTDGTVAAGVGTDENGMGSAVGDYDADGDLDWFVSAIFDDEDRCAGTPCNWGSSGNRLYRNEGGRSFSDQTDEAGVRDGGWGWGSTFFDYDLDGDLDLAMTNGFRLDSTTLDDPYNHDPMRLWRNEGIDGFVEVAHAEGLHDTASGKGLLTMDYDQDGDLDLFVVNNSGEPVLYRNDRSDGAAWLVIDAEGTASNRDGIGVQISIDPDLSTAGDEQYREIDAGSNFLGQNEMIATFGLGDKTSVDLVRLQWPSGQVDEYYNVDANQRLLLIEAVPEPRSVVLAAVAVIALSFCRRTGRKPDGLSHC